MMVWWRFLVEIPGPWRFGFRSEIPGGLVRMGSYNGDWTGGVVVSPEEIEQRPYRG